MLPRDGDDEELVLPKAGDDEELVLLKAGDDEELVEIEAGDDALVVGPPIPAAVPVVDWLVAGVWRFDGVDPVVVAVELLAPLLPSDHVDLGLYGCDEFAWLLPVELQPIVVAPRQSISAEKSQGFLPIVIPLPR
jgi:hypothetical protein